MAVGAWPFTGRDTELAAARAALIRSSALVLAGEAGVGKTRFARELTASSDGAETVLVAASASSREVPLGAFAPVLGSTTDADDDLPAVQRAVRELGGRGSRTLVVDDAHQLDDVSATVVHQLAAGRAVKLLLVVRSGEEAPAAVTAIWKDGGAERIDLSPLPERQAGRLLHAALDGPIDVQAEQRLVAVSRGNVLWMRHLVLGEQAAGRLARTDGIWRWSGPAGLPPALDELVAARIGTLSEIERRVLELLSLSEPLGLDLLAGLSSADAVEEASERGLVEVALDPSRWSVRLAHPLYGEAVRARTSAARARRLRGELSAALRGSDGRRADDGLRRAMLDLGSDRRPEPDLLLHAGVHASGLGDFVLGERLLRAACDAGGGFEARLALAGLLTYLLRTDDALPEIARAVEEARNEPEMVRATLVHANLLHFMLGRPIEAAEVMARTETEIGAGTSPDFDGLRTMFDVAAGDLTSAARRGEFALRHDGLSAQATAYAVWGYGHVRARNGNSEGLSLLVERGMAAARRSPETTTLQANIGFCEILDADLRGEPELARHRLEWVHAPSGPHAATLRALYDGRMALSAGLPRRAIRLLESVLPYFPGHGGGWTLWMHAMIAQCHGMLGDGPAARRSLDATELARHPAVFMMDWEVALARGWVAAAEGARPEAIRYVLSGAAEAERLGIFAAEVLVRQTAVRFGARGQGPRLARLVREVGSTRARLAAAHADALAAADPDRLLALVSELEGTGMVLEAADVAAQAATLARTVGHLATATEAEQRARDLAAHGDARTPAVLDATAPLPLSQREREVATLAADGLTNRQIAERLGVSVRTVESHVYRACARLGLADRAAFVAVAVAPPACRSAEMQ